MPSETVNILLPEAEYTLFQTQRDGLPEVVIVNKSLLTFLHTDIFPWCLSIEIVYTGHADNEMPTPEQSETLDEIGDLIEDIVFEGRADQGGINAMFVARSTWGGSRELLYQVHDPDVAHDALQTLLGSKDWDLEWSYEMKQDAEWQGAGFYLKLFGNASGADA